jgi:hypothetical protein
MSMPNAFTVSPPPHKKRGRKDSNLQFPVSLWNFDLPGTSMVPYGKAEHAPPTASKELGKRASRRRLDENVELSIPQRGGEN